MATWKTIKSKECRETRYPGVWQLKEGGWWIRARAKSPKTGRLAEVNRIVEASDAAAASALLQAALDEIRRGEDTARRRMPRFSEFAASLTERKIADRSLTGRNSIGNWRHGLVAYLLPFFADMYIDQIRRADLERFKAALVGDRRCRSPNSVNHWLRMLKVIVRTFVAEYELPVDPMLRFALVDTTLHRTYTAEQPNSLEHDEQAAFLDLAMQHYPRLYAYFVLGFVLGQRPSTISPLRRKGPSPDILWESGKVLLRQSHTRGQEILPRTKTGKDLTIEAGPHSTLFQVLRWHVDQIPQGPEADSDLLFPTSSGRVISQSRAGEVMCHLNLLLACRPLSPAQAAEMDRRARGGPDNRRIPRALKAALAWARAQGWPLATHKYVSLRAMRRSYYNSIDAAQIEDRTARLVSGHSSEAMANRYRTEGSSGQGAQQREVLGRVISLVGVREQLARRAEGADSAPLAAPLQGRKLA